MEEKAWARGRDWWVEAAKPYGGFVLVRESAVSAAWQALQERRIELLDLRVWLALFEVVERRLAAAATTGAAREPRHSLLELRRLVGGDGEGALRSSVARLRHAGLLDCSSKSLRLLGGRGGLGCEGRRVPIPRPLLRHLAAPHGRAYIATGLGHLLRCLFLRKNVCRSGGYVKASWISQTFGVAERSVKEARGHMVAEGFLTVLAADQTRLNRFGAPVLINLDAGRSAESAPHPRLHLGESAPPEKHDQLSCQRSAHQQPADAADRAGFRSKVTLRDVQPSDLKDARRLARLFAQAQRQGLVRPCEADRLAFFGAALHARRVGDANPCGLFAWIVRNRGYHVISQEDEDLARRALARSTAFRDLAAVGPSPSVACPPVPQERGELPVMVTGVTQVTHSLLARITTCVGSAVASASTTCPG